MMGGKEIGSQIRAKAFAWVLRRAAALLLLFAVPGLSTIAKISWYLPQSDPGHYLTTATKMKVVDGHTDCRQAFRQPICGVFPPPPQIAIFLDQSWEITIPRMLLTAILPQRSPPSQFA